MSTILKKIDSTREQIANLENLLRDPANAHASRAELEAIVKAQIANWHERATDRIASDLKRLAAGDSSCELLAPADVGFALESSLAVQEQAADSRAWLTFALGKSEMLKRFRPLLDQMPEGRDADERAAYLADVQRQIICAEVDEERLLLEAEAEGVLVDPRRGQRAEAAILIGYGEAPQ